MEPSPHYKRVGLFLICSITAFIGAMLWLEGAFTKEASSKYLVFFEKQSLDGLQKDSTVTMKGIKVGTVENYNISTQNIERVRVKLRLESDVPIKVDTKATIKRNLLTGLARIDLIGGTQGSPLLKPDPKTGLPVIQEGLPGLDKIADSIPEVLNKLENIIVRANLLLSDKNIHHVEKAIASASTFAAHLESTGPAINDSAEKLDRILTTLDKTLKSASAENLEHAVANLSASTHELRELLVELKQVTKSVNPILIKTGRATHRIDHNIATLAQFFVDFLDHYKEPGDFLVKSQKEPE